MIAGRAGPYSYLSPLARVDFSEARSFSTIRRIPAVPFNTALGDQMTLAGTSRLATSATVQFFNSLSQARTFDTTLSLYSLGSGGSVVDSLLGTFSRTGISIGGFDINNPLTSGTTFVTFSGLNTVVPDSLIFVRQFRMSATRVLVSLSSIRLRSAAQITHRSYPIPGPDFWRHRRCRLWQFEFRARCNRHLGRPRLAKVII